MKYLITILLLLTTTISSWACEMSIPLSYTPTFLAPPVSGHYLKCDAKPDEQCLCIDDVNPWYAELVDEQDESGNVIGKKLINSGVKRDAYLAAQAAAAQVAAQEAQEKEQACKAIKQMPESAIDNMFEDIPANVSTVAALRAAINAKYAQQKQHAKNAKKCIP